MSDITHEAATKCCDTYHQVVGLYLSLKNPVARAMSPRRAELRQGSVSADPLDFCLDVMIKARRALKPEDYTEFLEKLTSDDFMQVPRLTQVILGQAFLQSRLDPDGDYKSLHFRARQDAIRDRVENPPKNFPEEEEINEEEQHQNIMSQIEAVQNIEEFAEVNAVDFFAELE